MTTALLEREDKNAECKTCGWIGKLSECKVYEALKPYKHNLCPRCESSNLKIEEE